MGDMEQEHILEIIPAYAIGSLDASEVESVRQHLMSCELCRSELDTYEKVVDALPMAAPDAGPSPELKGRLMDRLSATPAGEKIIPDANVPTRSGTSWWRQVSGAFQSLINGPRWRPAALLFIVVLVVSNALFWQQANRPDPNSWRRIRLTGSEVAPEATGIIYISTDGRNGTLIVDRLPQLGSERQYQLWLIEDGERTSGAIFSIDNEGYRGIQIESAEPLQNYSAFGITIEPAGGSTGPTGERVLTSSL
jgi:anti-sigma-K factor RskA